MKNYVVACISFFPASYSTEPMCISQPQSPVPSSPFGQSFEKVGLSGACEFSLCAVFSSLASFFSCLDLLCIHFSLLFLHPPFFFLCDSQSQNLQCAPRPTHRQSRCRLFCSCCQPGSMMEQIAFPRAMLLRGNLSWFFLQRRSRIPRAGWGGL